jgi:peptide/nickel transport system substrate-binding protein
LVKGVSTLEKRAPELVLEPNAEYWNPDRTPTVRISFDNVIPKAEALKDVAAADGEVDVVTELTPAEAKQIEGSDHASLVRSDAKTLLVGVFNQTEKDSKWNDPNLRQAVNYAIDRQGLIDRAMMGYGNLMPATILEGQFGYNDSLGGYPLDPARAKQLSKNARDKNVAIVTDEAHKAIADAVTADLKAAGFNATAKVRTPEGNWDIWLVEHFDWSPEYPVAVVFREFFAEGGAFLKSPGDADVQRMIAEAMATVDKAEQEKATQAIERHIYDHADLLFLFAPEKLYAVRDGVNFTPYKTTVLELAETEVDEDAVASVDGEYARVAEARVNE